MDQKVSLNGKTLKTKRLILRPFEDGDLEDFYEYAKEAGVGEMAGWAHHKDRDMSRFVLDIFIRGDHTFAVEHEGKVIGSLGIDSYGEGGIRELDALRTTSLGFVLKKDFWGLGLMQEAVNAVIDWLFSKDLVDVILCAYFKRNLQSKRLQEKLGFKPWKDTVYNASMGTEEDSVLNIMTKQDWEKRIRFKP